jgi:hypothetical protein
MKTQISDYLKQLNNDRLRAKIYIQKKLNPMIYSDLYFTKTINPGY